ncbi:MAG TPA: type II secretion system F family protein, partial [Bacillota bacterium]
MEYRYRTADALGRIETGTAQAESKEQLIQKLRAEGRYLLEIREQTIPEVKFRFHRFRIQDRLSFTQQLAGLLNAGITLERALAILNELQFGQELDNVLRQLRRSLEAGLSFTAALEKFPEYFPPLFINMVRAGEAGGILPGV